MLLFRYSFKSYCSAGSCWKSLRKIKSQFPILSGNNKTTTLLQLFEIEKNSWQTFRITYFFHQVYKRKLFLQLPEFQFFDVLLCLHTADHLTSPCLWLNTTAKQKWNKNVFVYDFSRRNLSSFVTSKKSQNIGMWNINVIKMWNNGSISNNFMY